MPPHRDPSISRQPPPEIVLHWRDRLHLGLGAAAGLGGFLYAIVWVLRDEADWDRLRPEPTYSLGLDLIYYVALFAWGLGSLILPFWTWRLPFLPKPWIKWALWANAIFWPFWWRPTLTIADRPRHHSPLPARRTRTHPPRARLAPWACATWPRSSTDAPPIAPGARRHFFGPSPPHPFFGSTPLEPLWTLFLVLVVHRLGFRRLWALALAPATHRGD